MIAQSPGPAASLSVTQVAQAYSGVPVRMLVTGPPGRRVDIRSSTQGAVGSVQIPAGGRVMAAWIPTSATKDKVAFRSGRIEVPLTVDVAPPGEPSTPVSARGRVKAVVRAKKVNQFISCAGKGGPTVVLIAGLWGWSKDWVNQVQTLRRAGRVCTYDRPGLGRSPGRTSRLDVDSALHADELGALLRRAGEKPPFLIVGHSYGGLVAQSFAARDPLSTNGMVLLDPVPIGFSDNWPAFGRTRTEAAPETTIDLLRSSVSAASVQPLVGLPLVLVTAGVAPSWLDQNGFKAWQNAHARSVAGCLDCLHWTAEGADHQLQDTAPDLTLKAIETVRTALRAHKPVSDVEAQ